MRSIFDADNSAFHDPNGVSGTQEQEYWLGVAVDAENGTLNPIGVYENKDTCMDATAQYAEETGIDTCGGFDVGSLEGWNSMLAWLQDLGVDRKHAAELVKETGKGLLQRFKEMHKKKKGKSESGDD